VCLGLGWGRDYLWAESWLPPMTLNLALAWAPYGLALTLEGVLCTISGWEVVYVQRDAQERRVSRARRWAGAGLALVWLAFLPNAAYLVTDVGHWRAGRGMPMWCDLVYLCAVAWTGLALCYGAVQGLHELLARRHGERAGWAFALGALALSTAGVYVGRFWRWNSWEVVTCPQRLAADVARLGDAAVAYRAMVFGGAFFALCAMSYALLHAVSGGARGRDGV
jgi:uncharacterized membrane protein